MSGFVLLPLPGAPPRSGGRTLKAPLDRSTDISVLGKMPQEAMYSRAVWFPLIRQVPCATGLHPIPYKGGYHGLES